MSKQPNWNLIAGIVLDAVGTLIKPVPSVADAYTEAARRQGVELNRDEVRARFNLNFQSDEVRGDRGLHSTDEATEIWRWRRIVTKVLPEVPDPQRAFDELWDHFGRPESWRCFPDVAPALRAIHEAGIAVCVGLQLRRPAPPGRHGASRAGLGRRRPGDLVGSWLSQAASGVLSGRLPASGPGRPARCSAWGTTWRTTCGVRCVRGFRPCSWTGGPSGRATCRMCRT